MRARGCRARCRRAAAGQTPRRLHARRRPGCRRQLRAALIKPPTRAEPVQRGRRAGPGAPGPSTASRCRPHASRECSAAARPLPPRRPGKQAQRRTWSTQNSVGRFLEARPSLNCAMNPNAPGTTCARAPPASHPVACWHSKAAPRRADSASAVLPACCGTGAALRRGPALPHADRCTQPRRGAWHRDEPAPTGNMPERDCLSATHRKAQVQVRKYAAPASAAPGACWWRARRRARLGGARSHVVAEQALLRAVLPLRQDDRVEQAARAGGRARRGRHARVAVLAVAGAGQPGAARGAARVRQGARSPRASRFQSQPPPPARRCARGAAAAPQRRNRGTSGRAWTASTQGQPGIRGPRLGSSTWSASGTTARSPNDLTRLAWMPGVAAKLTSGRRPPSAMAATGWSGVRATAGSRAAGSSSSSCCMLTTVAARVINKLSPDMAASVSAMRLENNAGAAPRDPLNDQEMCLTDRRPRPSRCPARAPGQCQPRRQRRPRSRPRCSAGGARTEGLPPSLGRRPRPPAAVCRRDGVWSSQALPTGGGGHLCTERAVVATSRRTGVWVSQLRLAGSARALYR